MKIDLADGRTFNGKVLGVDPATDLAVVKVDTTGLPTAVLGDSDGLLIGEPAIAIGNPLGMEFRGSVTVGVISALNRSIEIGERKFKLIQTDAAINPGNSGGALVNADGVVVGINSAKIAVAGVEGIGFAIPINTARPILQSVIEKGRVVRAYLGVGVLDRNTAAR
ncbi:putative serine protease HtrA [bioreactor metagenome]|uniref:Putative serine protease HtrA n=1 Tax=bioreactor metagenome TaxID=1076179 RepID=A0A644SUY7_9ZZZZ